MPKSAIENMLIILVYFQFAKLIYMDISVSFYAQDFLMLKATILSIETMKTTADKYFTVIN